MNRFVITSIVLFLTGASLRADVPVASYIFPAGGQRGAEVKLRVGGLNLHERCGFELLGPGVEASRQLERMKTLWFEGPLLPLPDSQRQEDYPKDMAGKVKIAADAPLGIRHWRLWTSQGATPSMRFLVGDLPEVVEEEIDGDPVPVPVTLPVTINGRIFPREDVDVWSFEMKKGQSAVCEVQANRLGTLLDSRLEVLDSAGRPIAENDDDPGPDSFLRFTAPADGTYRVRIHDINFKGGPAYVYRLTITTDSYVERVFPLGGRRGEKVAFEVTGQGLPNQTVSIALPADGPRDFSHRLTVSGKLTNPFLLDLDDLPEHREAEPNNEPAQAKKVEVPAVLNGRIDSPGDADCWAITGRKGEALELDLRAARLGSPLSGVMAVLDDSGKELARAEPGPQGDPLLRFTPPADGVFRIRVEDRLRSRGGPAFAYRFRIDRPAAPDFRLQLATNALSVDQGGTAKLRVSAERLGGFADAIALEFDGLPGGVSAANTTIAAKQATVEIVFKADAAAPIRTSHLTIRGSAKIGEALVSRTAGLAVSRGVPALETVLVAVAIPTPFKVVGEYDMRWAARGTMHQRRYRIERNGYTGPLQVRLGDKQARHLQGVTGETITVPAEASEFDYAIFLPPWMETGRTSRTCVMAIGIVKDAEGNEHTVSFTSVNTNEQLVAVIEPGRLSVEASPGSLSAAAGTTGTVQVKVARGKGLEGPVKLELVVPAHLRGIELVPTEIPADRNETSISIRFAESPGPLTMPLTLRATLRDKGKPVVAETALKLVAGR